MLTTFGKVWLSLTTVWLVCLTVAVVNIVDSASFKSPYDPKAMFTRWYGDRLNIGAGQGRFIITHLEDTTRHSVAELPQPIYVASSGGVFIPVADLQKLVWKIPPDVHYSAFPDGTNVTVAAPAMGAPIEAHYLFLSRAQFKAGPQ